MSKVQALVRENSIKMQDEFVRGYGRHSLKPSAEHIRYNKVFNSSTLYLGAVIWAFVLYQLDYRYNLNDTIGGWINALSGVSLIHEPSFLKQFGEKKGWLLLLTVLIVSFVLALKEILLKRKLRKETSIAQAEEMQRGNQQSHKLGFIESDSEDQVRDIHQKGFLGCERISPEEFNFQSDFNTRKEVLKLTNSDAYKEAMRAKGGKIEKFNWQVADRAEGFLPQEDEKEAGSKEFDFLNELDKVENEIKAEKRAENAAQRALAK